MELTGKPFETLKYFMAGRWLVMAIIGGLSFLVAFFEGLSTVAIYPVLAIMMPAQLGENSKLLDGAITWARTRTSIAPLYIAIGVLFAITIIKIALNYINTVIVWVCANKIFQDTQIKMMGSLMNSDYQFLVNAQKGDLVYRLLTAPGYVSKVINQIPLMGVELLKIVMMLAVLFIISPWVTGILLFTSFLYYLFSKAIAQRVSYGTGSGRARSSANQTIHAMNALKGIKSIRLFNAAGHWVELFSRECRSFYRFAFKDTIFGGIPTSLLELVYISFICSMVLYFDNTKGGLIGSVPVLGVFAYSILKILPSLKTLSTYGLGLMAMLPHAEAAYLALTEAEIHQETIRGTEKLDSFRSLIEGKNVLFSYLNSPRPVIKEINFIINKGEFVGIVGVSGSGKTTLLDILAGLLKPTSGEVLLDGKAIYSYRTESLAAHIGYMGQETFLFNDTIRENVLFGRRGFSDSAVAEALRKADIGEFVASLPGALDFILADDGLKISGGQRQRLSIARALLSDPEILLLDEATSALDLKAEENVMETILKLVRNEKKTVIFVTHRRSAIRGADRVFEMQDGNIINVVSRKGSGDKSALPV